ncbi:hypothetical protein CISIN_1g028737mg [Citrus sinensis]|uniref:Proteasome subunit beta n=1 Tax=Citrus sinensis TaxID=2711 RepID=A0A067GYK4_CITSI|nr:hypothetical protein CISIN_1g028737mg [Citrus sinensis]
MSITEYNGSALVAMVGKNCFAIASDRRLGVQLQTIATDFQRISKIHDRLFIGLSGLATDSQTLYQRLVFRHKLYQLREERDMKPETFASLVSALLYEKRFGPYFCQPVIAGLSDEDKPFICTMDSIGAKYVGYTSLLVYFPSKKYCFLDCFGNLFSFFKDLPKGKER